VPEVFAPGRVLGDRYRLDHMLARGGMATVWVAEDPLLSRKVAVKLLHPALAIDDALRTRFRNEATSAAKLTHPGIVATYDTGDDDGVAYIVMELVDGSNLRTVLDQQGQLSVEQAIDIASQVADALEHAHRNGLVHRDVKPANVLVQPDGRVKVTDFGIAKAAGTDDLTRTGTVIGTARYLAPEQVNGESVDARADVYALGLVLYEMLTGKPPFGGDTDVATAVARLTSAPQPLRSVRPDVTPAVEDVVARTLARDPDYRYSSAQAFREALTGSARAPAGAAPRPTAGTRPPAARAPAATGPPRAGAPGRAGAPPGRTSSTMTRQAPRPLMAPRHRRWPWAVLAILLAVAAVAGYLIATRDERGGSPGAPVGGAQLLPVSAASDFDPQGDTREENSDQVGRAIDGDTGTAWPTETYRSPATEFGGTKDGVGIAFDLGSDKEVSEVRVEARGENWDGQIYVSDVDGPELDDWGQVRSSGSGLSAQTLFPLDPAARGRYVLLWITRLPTSGRLEISEVAVAGS
jgi:serine/threonine-protein kinase